MTSPTQSAFTARLDPSLREPFEVGEVQWLRRPGDGDRPGLMAGFWTVTPEEMPPATPHEFPFDETIYVVEGAMRIEIEGGETLELAEGDTASFNKGAKVAWTIHRPVTEFFVYS
jgi:uncharacterized cupin superfamily protein